MKIVVAGAIGHIGSYVVRDLAHQFPSAATVMIDNMMTQRFPSLFNLPATGRYRFLEADVTSTCIPHFSARITCERISAPICTMRCRHEHDTERRRV